MARWFHYTRGVLRAEPWILGAVALPQQERIETAQPRFPLLRLTLVGVGFGVAYGAVMGTFGGIDPQRWVQATYSAIKVPALLGITFALSLPSFFVINTLLGLRDDFRQVIRALLATQAGLTIILASLAPFTALWYLSVPDYGASKLFNTAMFGVASVASQVQLARHYRPLIARRPIHRVTLSAWLIVYAFVGVQLAWTLRPFIGAPGMDTHFFREGAFTNAYVEMFNLLWKQLGG